MSTLKRLCTCCNVKISCYQSPFPKVAISMHVKVIMLIIIISCSSFYSALYIFISSILFIRLKFYFNSIDYVHFYYTAIHYFTLFLSTVSCLSLFMYDVTQCYSSLFILSPLLQHGISSSALIYCFVLSDEI